MEKFNNVITSIKHEKRRDSYSQNHFHFEPIKVV